MRLDVYLTEKNLADTRTRAKNLIELGNVEVNGSIITKPAFFVQESDTVSVIENYAASLGSLKLEKALDVFKPEIKGKICLDLGAANGGFTDVLLQKGAKKVYALDIGECALVDYLQNDPRVIIRDKTNARFIKREDFNDKIDFITGDLSFISLKLILPVAHDLLEKGECIFLIKPQFETEKKKIPKSGIIKDSSLRKKIVDEICRFSQTLGFTVLGTTEAPHPFENKNQEYLLYLSK